MKYIIGDINVNTVSSYFNDDMKENDMKENDMKKYDITAFGEILIDFTYVGNSEEGQKLFAQNAGGAPANVLVCATKFGAKTAFMGKVGDDMHGSFLKQTIENEGVDTKGLVVDKDYFTTLAFVDLNEKGERSFSFARKHGADTFMRKEDLCLAILRETKIFHIGSLSLTTPLGRETTLDAIEEAKVNGALISYDPNYRASLWENEASAIEAMRSIIPYANVMKLSDEECELLTGEKEPEKAAKYLNDMGIEVVCVTLGAEGVYLSTSQSQQRVEGFIASKVVDTTGAGDSFWGAFLSKLVDLDKPLEEVTEDEWHTFATFANATASLCVERSGAIRAMPTREEVTNRLKASLHA